MTTPTAMTVKEVAARLRLKKTKNVLLWIRQGLLSATDVSPHQGNATWRIDPADLEAFLLTRRSRPPEPPKKKPAKLGRVEKFF